MGAFLSKSIALFISTPNEADKEEHSEIEYRLIIGVA
jgi:hypothetical protein